MKENHMHYLAATLHTLGVKMNEHARTKIDQDPERGSVTIEQVLWAIAMIAIVGIVVAAITAYVTSKSGNIK